MNDGKDHSTQAMRIGFARFYPPEAHELKRGSLREAKKICVQARGKPRSAFLLCCMAAGVLWMGRLAAATNGAPLDFSSNLPLVIIETHRQVITQWLKFRVTATVIDTANGRSSLLGPVEYSGWAEMNIRGNSSRAHPKKAYRLEIQNDTGQDLKVPLLGMPKESDWILYPAYTDKTLVRDAL